ncbi:MAG TPA: YggS family pyridoxal phosphate-dependent enzyme [Pyrinomonadaceae bacterium]|nr:YggS family pyridoxal phosphate-dependent enzyme [Pyrinomonadaceae bacterium]
MTTGARSVAETLRERFGRVRGRIEAAARRAGREPEGITLVAVSKTHPVELLREALGAGVREFGENKVQEADDKAARLGRADGMRWHLIGRLQSNKARRAALLFDLIHTVDSAALVGRLERVCAEEGRERLEVLVQVDLAGEATKAGAPPEKLPAVFDALAACERVRCRGLMTLPPFEDDPERVRPYFRRLRELRDEWAARGHFGGGAGELSMGMSHDFEPAIEEGATLVRVGTAVFGRRPARA